MRLIMWRSLWRSMWRSTLAVLLCAGLADAAVAGVPRGDPGAGRAPAKHAAADAPRLVLEPSAMEPGGTEQLEVGTYAPDFEAEGSFGQPVALADLKGTWAVMVFSDTRTTFSALRDLDDDMRAAGANLYGICEETAPALRTYADREQIRFTLLSDTSREISEQFGMYDAALDAIRPGIVILDPQGVVRAALPGRALQPGEIMKLTEQSLAVNGSPSGD